MKKTLTLLLLNLLLLTGYTQITKTVSEPNWNLGLAESIVIPIVEVDSPDLTTIYYEDSIESLNKQNPFRFGIAIDQSIDLTEAAQISTYNNWSRYELEIRAPGAKSINLNFSHFYLPKGTIGYIKSVGTKDRLGALGNHNNKMDGDFSTRPIQGDHLKLDFYVPSKMIDSFEVAVSQIIFAYKDIFHKGRKTFGSSGNCNRNINCPEADIWQDVKRSVVMILASNNTRLCTGTLINNVKQDSTPYLLTASHCNLATNSIFVFGYENSSPNCLTNADGSVANSISGAFARAENTYSDFKLFELSSTPPASYQAYYAGWDARGIAPYQASTIHHPSGDIKKFSQDQDSAISSAYSPPNNNTHWQIGNWEIGTTEQGSSGAPLFDAFKRVVGQLEGGSASCSQNLEDYFGKFSESWNHDPATNRQLQYWLDPDTSNTLIMDGFDPLPKANNTDIELSDVSHVPSYSCDSSLSPVVHFMNIGNDSITNVQILYGTNFQFNNSTNWVGVSYTESIISVVLPALSISSSDTVINVKLITTPLDQDTSNNSWSKTIKVNSSPLAASLTFKTDLNGNELSWDIRDTVNSYVLYKGGPYMQAPNNNGFTFQYNLCLSEDCFDLNLYDAYGDGFNGPFSGNGYALIRGPYGDTLVYEANFTSYQKTRRFCINDTTTSISEYKLEKGLKLYPNPVQKGGLISIESEKVSIVELRLIDIKGRSILIQRGNSLRVPQHLRSGLYLIQLIHSSGEVSSKKLIVE